MWMKVCHREHLIPESGRAALVGQQQLALFYLPSIQEQVFAIGNWDPIGKAFVISRGIVGDIAGQLCVASPLYKQHFQLATGECIEQKDIQLPVWKTQWRGEELWIRMTPKPG